MADTPAGASQRRGILFVISAPSGAGKTTLVNALVERDSGIQVSISHTTRRPRPNETDGVSYHFVDAAVFARMIGEDAFLEHARVFDQQYGTSRRWVEQRLAAGTDVILEIDWQGAQQVRRMLPGTIGIFVLPPSLAVLRERLRGRGEDDATIERRMRDARAEIAHFGEYDYVVVNADRAAALADLTAIVRAARHSYALHRAHLDAIAARLQAGEAMQ